MSKDRKPVLRQPTSAEELAKLHPVERALLRLFEMLSSIKLAVLLMLWLAAECAVGTFIESQVNTPAAKYFVYSTWRFALLLALLGLNILCAALIRFPWRLYQTGFVITHAGLLILLAGSLMTAKQNIDAQMPVGLNETKNAYFNPDRERLVIGFHADGDMDNNVFPVEFGPMSWGHVVFKGTPLEYTWTRNLHQWYCRIFNPSAAYKSEYQFDNGVTVRVKRFLANCSPEEIVVDGGSKSDPPAVKFRLYHPERADITRWVKADRQSMRGVDRSFPVGEIKLWRINSDEELDHFVNAVPKTASPGLLGTLTYTHKGKHYEFDVATLRETPAKVPGTDVTLSIAEYIRNVKLDPSKGGLVEGEGDVPRNPLLKITVNDDGVESEHLAFGAQHDIQAVLAMRDGTEHQFSYFPASIPAVVHLAVMPEGTMGYRAISSQGLITSVRAEEGKEYPCWAGLNFVPLKIVGAGRPELQLQPKKAKRGKPGNKGLLVEIKKGSESAEAALVQGMPVTKLVGGKIVTVGYDIEQGTLPFEIRLNDFEEPTNPGTRQAAAYKSRVTVIDDSKMVKDDTEIYMNHPLYYKGSDGIRYTLFQSGIDRSTGKPISTFTVANDPGLEVKYAGCVVLCVGIFMMFYMGGYFRRGSGRRSAAG